MMGSDLRDWLPVTDRPRLTKLFLTALAGRATDTVEVELLTRQGGSVRTMWSVAAISRHGKVEAVVAVGQDQTRLVELQSQVIQAEKLATLGQLAAGVVHELNNPLTSITVYAEYLLKKSLAAAGDPDEVTPDPGDVEKLRRISAGAQRILEFAKDLVQYAKPAGDELDVIAINNVVRHSLSFCEHLFEHESIELTQQLTDELPAVYAVPGQLEQVVINLVTNAAHAVEGKGAVTVRTFVAEPGVVGLSIADTGPGIPAADRERVFEPFFTTKPAGAGTGLGLSMSHDIVEQGHGGRLHLEGAPGHGATFVLTLPR
jgi:signal transduction histidine kinase